MKNKLKLLEQIIGVGLVAVAGHGLVRLLIDHNDVGIFGWLSKDFYTLLVAHILLIIIGMATAARSVKSL